MNQVFLLLLVLSSAFDSKSVNKQLIKFSKLQENLEGILSECKSNENSLECNADVCEFCIDTVQDLQMMLSDDFVQTVLSSVVCQYFPYQSECIEYMKEFLQEFVELESRYICETLYMCENELLEPSISIN